MTNISATRVSAPISRRQVVLGAAALLLVRFSGKAAFAEPRTFFIFFDKESSELLPSAKQILAVINPLISPTRARPSSAIAIRRKASRTSFRSRARLRCMRRSSMS